MKSMSALLPDVSPNMLSADFWVSDSDIGADRSRYRDEYQAYIRNHPSMNQLVELLSLDAPLEALKLKAPLPNQSGSQSGSQGQTLYDADGHVLTADFWAALTEKVERATPVDASAAAAGRLQPGFAVRRANLRRYPTARPAFRTAADREFDRFQDTALHTFEPVLLALQTEDREWYYVVSETYKGWVAAKDIARCTVEEFTTWSAIASADAGEPRFVIPLANNIYTQAAPYDECVSAKRLEFAACVPVCHDQQGVGNQSVVGNLACWLPVRNRDGYLDVRRALVPASAPVSVGFQPYTRKSVVQSAFALLGERYGWGDSFGNHDCSSFIMDSYRSVGLQLPRDAGKQEDALPNRIQIPEALTFQERSELLKTLGPGDPLYMPGHTMMYLGYRDGHHYAIHDFSGYTVWDGDEGANVPVNEVMVSTLDIRLSSGKTYLEALTTVASLFEKTQS